MIIQMENKYKNLHVGQIFKSYRQVCEALGEKVKSGDSKKAQLKEWGRFFLSHKDGNKIIIDEIYENPKDKLDDRSKGNNSVYSELIQLLIVDLLNKSKGHITITKNKLFQKLGMVNENYADCKNIMNRLSEYLSIDKNIVLDFYNTNNSNFKYSVESALDKLMDRRVLFYNKITMIKEISSDEHRPATLDEMQLITLVENKILVKMGYNYISEVRKSSNWSEFKKTTTQTIHNLSDIDYYYSAYEIAINYEALDNTKISLINDITQQIERGSGIRKLNSLVIDKIESNAQNRHIEASKSEELDEKILARQSDDYVANINKLSNVLISRSHPRISNKILTTNIRPKNNELLENIF